MQYTVRDWRNRNRIKTPEGAAWLSIPVEVKGKRLQKIKETVISEPGWNERHWATLVHNYSKAPFFREEKDWLEELYLKTTDTYLSRVNLRFLKAICDRLGIITHLSWSMDYMLMDGKTERLVSLCKQAHADRISFGSQRTRVHGGRVIQSRRHRRALYGLFQLS